MTSKASINREIVVESVPSAIEGVCERILANLEANNFSEDDIFAVHLAVEEAFLNAVRHGSKMDPNKEITIHYSLEAYEVESSMTDRAMGSTRVLCRTRDAAKIFIKPTAGDCSLYARIWTG